MTIKTMLEAISEDKLSESTESFKTILADKVKDKLQESKKILAKTIFTEEIDYSEIESITEAYKESNPKINLHHKETGEYLTSTNWSPTVKHAVAGYEAKHPNMVGKVKGVKESLEENTESDDDADDKEFSKKPESVKHRLNQIASYTKNKPEEDMEITKAGVPSLHSVKAHTTKGDIDRTPTFLHANGERSKPTKDQALHIVAHIDQMKPDLRSKVFHVMHNSKDGFDKVSAALMNLPLPKSKI